MSKADTRTRAQDATLGTQQAVIGALLIDPEPVAPLIMDRLQPEDFRSPELRHLFEAAREIYLEHRPLDAVTVVDRAGEAYAGLVADLMRNTPTAANVEEYTALLLQQAKHDRLKALAWEILDTPSFDEARDALGKSYSLLLDQPHRRASSLYEMIERYCDRMNDPAPPNYLDWGMEKLNKVASISPGRFVILGADSSVGKTALALQFAQYMGLHGRRVGFYSYETSRDDAVDRILANIADVNLPRTKKKALTKNDWLRVAEAADRAYKAGLDVIEAAGWTVEDVQIDILAHRYDVAFLDYVQLVPAGFIGDPTREVRQVSMALHTMAQRLGVTVVALSQVTLPEKPANGKRRTITRNDLRESKQLKNDADAIFLLDLSDPDDPKSRRVLKVDKNKDGKCGAFELDFFPENMRFIPVSKNDADKPNPDQVHFEELDDDKEPLPF